MSRLWGKSSLTDKNSKATGRFVPFCLCASFHAQGYLVVCSSSHRVFLFSPAFALSSLFFFFSLVLHLLQRPSTILTVLIRFTQRVPSPTNIPNAADKFIDLFIHPPPYPSFSSRHRFPHTSQIDLLDRVSTPPTFLFLSTTDPLLA